MIGVSAHFAKLDTSETSSFLSADTSVSTSRVQIHALVPSANSKTSGRLIQVSPRNSDDTCSKKSFLAAGSDSSGNMSDNEDENHAETVNEHKDDEEDGQELDNGSLTGDDLPDNSNGDVRNGGRSEMSATGNYQAGVIEMSTMIATSDLSRSESTELLNLSLHQVCRLKQNIFVNNH